MSVGARGHEAHGHGRAALPVPAGVIHFAFERDVVRLRLPQAPAMGILAHEPARKYGRGNALFATWLALVGHGRRAKGRRGVQGELWLFAGEAAQNGEAKPVLLDDVPSAAPLVHFAHHGRMAHQVHHGARTEREHGLAEPEPALGLWFDLSFERAATAFRCPRLRSRLHSAPRSIHTSVEPSTSRIDIPAANLAALGDSVSGDSSVFV